MLLGDSGVGKTPLAGQAPRAVFIAAEKGTISAKRFGSDAKLIRAYSWPKLEAAADYLEAHPDEFDWAIIDSVPKLQMLLLRYLLEQNVEENKAKADLDLPALADHQKWQNQFKRFIDRLVDIDVNMIFIATTMRVEVDDGDDTRDIVLPAIQGKPKEGYTIAQYVCAQMDAVYHLRVKTDRETGEPVWRLMTKARPPYFAKDRFNAHPAVVREPNMAEIIQAIWDSVEGGTAGPSRRKPRARAVVEELDDAESDEEEPEEDPAPRKPRRQRQAASGQTRAQRRARETKAGKPRQRFRKVEQTDDEIDEIELDGE